MKPILVLVQPLRISDNTRVAIRVGDAATPEAYGLGGYNWEPAISKRPSRVIELFSPDMDGQVQTGRASIALALKSIIEWPDAQLYDWAGAPITIYSAPDLGWSKATVDFDGLIKTPRLDLDTLGMTIDAEVSTAIIEKPILTAEFTGAGGIDGEAATRGTLKPAGFGTVEYIEPVWFNTVDNIGMIDGYANCLTIDRLMEGANDMGARVADYATYALLQAAIAGGAVPKGRWASCVAQGLVGLGAPPAGVIGVNATFGGGKPGSFMLRLLQTHAGIAVGKIETTAFDALTASVEAAAGDTADIGWWTKDQVQVKDMLEQMAASCNATPILNLQGIVSVTRAVTSAAAGTLDRSGSVEPRVINWRSADSEPPYYKIRARTARPARVLTRDEVNFLDNFVPAGVFDIGTVYRAGNTVFSSDGAEFLYINVTAAAGHTPPAATIAPAAPAADAWWQQIGRPAAYADGTSIEALKPAEAGANKTETRTAAAIASQGVLATKDVAALGSTGQVVRQDGTTKVTDATAITSLGTAAAIASQGALATASQVNLGSGGVVYRQDGTTHLTDALAVTSLGTAAAIAGQGTGATANNLSQLNATEGTKLTGIAAGATVGLNLMPNANLSDGSNFYSVGTGVRTAASAGDPAPFFVRYAGAAGTLQGPSLPVPANAGSVFVGWWERHSAAGGFTTQSLNFYNTAGTLVGATPIPMANPSYSTASTAWALLSGWVTVPSGAVSMQQNITPQPTAGLNFDVTMPFIQVAQNSADVTSLNTAAAIASQGALATANYSYYGTGGTIKEAFGGTDATLANFKTGLGTAAAIASQGSFATLSQTYFGDGLLKETSGGATATLANFKTSSGTAAAIASQGALATLGQVNLGSTGQVYRQDATTRLTDALAVTSLGTAAAIASQGSYATLSQTYFGDGLLKETSGGATATLANFKTSSGTAAAIAGQGALATKSTADFSADISGNKPDVYATQSDNLILNATITDGTGGLSGWAGTTVTRVSSVYASGDPGLFHFYNSSGGNLAIVQPSRPVGDIKTFYLSYYAKNTTAGSQFSATIECYAADQSTFVGYAILFNDFSVGTAWLRRETSGAAPAGTAYYRVAISVPAGGRMGAIRLAPTQAAATLGGAFNSNVFRNDGVTLVTDASSVTSLGTAAAIAGQGTFATKSSADLETEITNKGRIAQLTAAGRVASTTATLNSNNNFGLRAVSTTPGMSASVVGGTSATVTFDSAGVLVSDSGASISLPSASFSGLALSTTYYFWRTMATPDSTGSSAGSYSYSTTLTDALATNKVYLGYYTTPASGGGGGGGGGFGGNQCPAAYALVETRDRGWIPARDVVPGDYARCLTFGEDGKVDGWEWLPCISNRETEEAAVRVSTASGHTLDLSVSTPMTLLDGTVLPVAEIAAHLVPVWRDVLLAESCTVEAIGRIPVCRISFGGGTFLAGNIAGRGVFSHNPIKP